MNETLGLVKLRLARKLQSLIDIYIHFFRKNLEELDDTPVLQILFGRWEIWKVLRPPLQPWPSAAMLVDTFIVKSAIEHLVKTGPQVCISRVWR